MTADPSTLAAQPDDESDVSIFSEAGASGLVQYGGHIREEFLTELQGRRGARTYAEMAANNALLGAATLAIDTLIRRVEFRVDPAKDSGAEGEAIAEKVESCRTDMDTRWTDFLSHALSMVVFGYAPVEVVYKIRRGEVRDASGALVSMLSSKHADGWIGWRSFAPRAQDSIDRWDFDEAGRWCGLWQQPEGQAERYIARARLLNFRPRAPKDSPEGYSMLRPAYRSYYFLKRFQEIEAIGCERRAVGVPVVEVPLDVAAQPSSTAYVGFKKLAEGIRRDTYAGVVMPAATDSRGVTGYKLSLLTTGGDTPAEFDPIIKRYESRILMAFLAEFILLGMDKVGSFALSSDKTDLFAMVLETLLGVIVEEINDVEIPRLCRLNGVPPHLFPSLAYGDIEKADTAAITASIAQLLGAGAITGGPKLSRWILEQLGAPVDDMPDLGPMLPALPDGVTAADAYAGRTEPAPAAAAPAIAKARTFEPTEAMRAAAERGLKLREEWGRGGLSTQEAGAAGSKSGVARASSLANGDALSEESVRAMARFFARHAKNRGGPDAREDDGGPTAGWIAWLLWGGDDGAEWASRILDEIEG